MKILAIVLIIVVVAGGAYFAGTKTNTTAVENTEKKPQVADGDPSKIIIDNGESF